MGEGHESSVGHSVFTVPHLIFNLSFENLKLIKCHKCSVFLRAADALATLLWGVWGVGSRLWSPASVDSTLLLPLPQQM